MFKLSDYFVKRNEAGEGGDAGGGFSFDPVAFLTGGEVDSDSPTPDGEDERKIETFDADDNAPLTPPDAPEEEDDQSHDEDENDAENDDDAPESDEEEGDDVAELTDDYEIEVADGIKAPLGQMKQAFQNQEAVKNAAQHVQQAYTEVKQKQQRVESQFQLSLMEADSILKQYENTDWSALAAEDQAQYAAHRQYFDKIQARKNQLEADYGNYQQEQENEKLEQRRLEAQQATEVLQRDINLTPESYKSMVEFGLKELGINPAVLDEITDPGIYKALHFAAKYHNGIVEKTAKVKKPKVTSATKGGKRNKLENVNGTGNNANRLSSSDADIMAQFGFKLQ